MSETECGLCWSQVDEEGYSLAECAARGMPAECSECGACICDGSC